MRKTTTMEIHLEKTFLLPLSRIDDILETQVNSRLEKYQVRWNAAEKKLIVEDKITDHEKLIKIFEKCYHEAEVQVKKWHTRICSWAGWIFLILSALSGWLAYGIIQQTHSWTHFFAYGLTIFLFLPFPFLWWRALLNKIEEVLIYNFPLKN
jgi:hypothetical protein